MLTSHRRSLPAIVLALIGLVAGLSAQDPKGTVAQSEPTLTVEEMKAFLLNAKVVRSRGTPKGVTSPYRLTLTDGKLTHEAGFQAVDERAPRREFNDGTVEFNFVDSYRYDIAAYELATLVGLGDMMPVTVERTWEGKTGALTWWLPVAMDEQTRLNKKIHPPDVEAWNRQMFKKRIFAELVYDTDPNLTNVLISADWHLWMIDFSRAFRLSKELRSPKNVDLSKCSKDLLEHLRAMTRADVERVVGEHLLRYEIDALMARRDKIVAIIDANVAKKGEAAVLFTDKRP